MRTFVTFSSILALAATATVPAQEPPAESSSAGNEQSLSEVIVTAQRREQRLQDVPLAVTALSSGDMERLQIRDTIDVIQHIPNLIGNNNVGLGSSNTYYIRGVGNTESIATQDVPVGTYVDDIYISRQNANNFGLFDVERIEVLRGPQGTLFGRNTTGGAINVIMKKPSSTLGGYLEAATGARDQLDFRGSIDIPLSERACTKFSAFRRNNDGYATQLLTGERLNDLDSWGVRAAFRLLPSDGLTIDLTADLIDDENANLINRVDPTTGRRVVPVGITQGALEPYFTGRKRFNKPGNEARTWSSSANVQWELEAVTLNSITGYRRTRQLYFIDSVGAPPNPIATGVSPILNDGTHEQWSQEFRATGSALNDNLDYVVGLYYLREDNETDLGTGVGSATGFRVSGDRTIENTLSTYAAYAQADYHFAERFTATLGLRYTKETKKLRVQSNPGSQGPVFDSELIAAAGIPLELDEDFLTPRVALSYRFNPDVMFFVSATRGAKSGGWNGRALANNLFLPFDPEKVWSEEIGMRSEFFDGRLRLNVTGFYAYTEDVQIAAAYTTSTGERIFTTTNPADLRNYGGEIEAVWRPVPRLTISMAIGLQHARYTDISQAVQEQLEACRAALDVGDTAGIAANCNRGFVDFVGRIATPVRAPDLSLVADAMYDVVTRVATISPSVAINYNDGYAIGNVGNPESTDGSWTRNQFLWNASVLVRPRALTNLSFTLECENCSDKTYNVSFLSPTGIYLNPPRTWSVRVRYDF